MQDVERLGVQMLICKHCLDQMGYVGPPPPSGRPAATVGQANQNFIEVLANRPLEEQGTPVLFVTDGRPGRCQDCNVEFRWYRTVEGRWLALGLETVDTVAVPFDDRCYVDSDGHVVPMGRKYLAQSRFPHRLVCPARPAPGYQQLKAIWLRNRF